jgi:hypothetical protein
MRDCLQNCGMKLESRSTAGSLLLLILGWFFSAIPILMMGIGGAIMLIANRKMVVQQMTHYGYPESAVNILLAAEIGSAIIYAIPQTAVLGAIMLTGYLGGATDVHVRAGEPQWFFPIIIGVIVWLGLFLRDKRLRSLLPFRR